MFSHKKYVVALFVAVGAASAAILLALMDFRAEARLEAYNPPGIAHYDLPYDLLFPTPQLITKAFISPITNFPRRDTVVLIGNSVIAGVGAHDRLTLHKSLTTQFNVINAGLSGEYLPASISLAVLGMAAATAKQPDGFFHIFIAYPTNRLYLIPNASGYWVTGPALYAMANSIDLSRFIFKGDGLLPMGELTQALHDTKNLFVMNMRCVINQQAIMKFLHTLDSRCTQAIRTEAVGAEVPLQINPQMLKFMEGEVRQFIGAAYRKATLKSLDEQSKPLILFLEERKIKHKISFILLGDPPDLMTLLPQELRQSYLLARTQFMLALQAREPEWIVEELNDFATSDYSDSSHMNSNGQTRLASHMLRRSAGRAGNTAPNQHQKRP